MATKKPKVSIYLPPELKTQLEDWAEEENRSVSNLVETVLKDAISNRQQQKQKAS
ncbi:ribbon-helix-helix domain-containing protein [Dolichospermum sp. UHCC 0352]|uniref:ribbon-helix-helix domain-containing protein n=1 Tax=Nostocales TaxID=1161 RepID=UPI00352D36A2